MYRPDLAEMLQGALGDPAKSVHYVTTFRYPLRGGFSAYLRPLAERFELRLGHQLLGLDPKRRALRFANGAEARYARVVSSIPLPELIPLIDGVPGDVREAASHLAFSTVVLVDLGVDREDLSNAHITYIYDEDVIFPRISFPHMFSPHNVPPGAGSIQVELYFSDKYRPLDRSPASLIDPVIAGLRQIGTLRENDRILFRGARVARYANVIYDHDRAKALAAVHGFLDEIEVHYCGRYGDWDHAWTDEAFLSGERAARAALACRS
jgi:protoporphyrinogen oxidase